MIYKVLVEYESGVNEVLCIQSEGEEGVIQKANEWADHHEKVKSMDIIGYIERVRRVYR